jgi:dTDP-4-amino-4,6-dideoxygalactose transaminase
MIKFLDLNKINQPYENAFQNKLKSVLDSGWYILGEEVKLFERNFANYCQSKYCIGVGNGFDALTLIYKAYIQLGKMQKGDEVIVTPRSYIASAMSVILVGARPVFADVDAKSGNITAASVEAVRTPRTKACLPVHIAGWPCDMPAISAWGAEHGVHIIEDCAQAHGASIGGRRVGTWGIFSSWSFCQDKIMTTGGEGGMLCTPDKELWKKAWQFAQHGKNYDLAHSKNNSPGFRWLVHHEGTNLRMTEMQAAIGLCQLRKDRKSVV